MMTPDERWFDTVWLAQLPIGTEVNMETSDGELIETDGLRPQCVERDVVHRYMYIHMCVCQRKGEEYNVDNYRQNKKKRDTEEADIERKKRASKPVLTKTLKNDAVV